MIYRLFELVRFLGLKPGLFEQPGNGSPEGNVGADHDQTLTQFATGSTGGETEPVPEWECIR